MLHGTPHSRQEPASEVEVGVASRRPEPVEVAPVVPQETEPQAKAPILLKPEEVPIEDRLRLLAGTLDEVCESDLT